MDRPSAYDINHDPKAAWNKFDTEVKGLATDLYILTVGAKSLVGEMPHDIKLQLLALARTIRETVSN